MLTPDDFEELRREICASGRASGGDNLVGMAIDFDLCLGASEDADAVPACGRTWMFSASRAPTG